MEAVWLNPCRAQSPPPESTNRITPPTMPSTGRCRHAPPRKLEKPGDIRQRPLRSNTVTPFSLTHETGTTLARDATPVDEG